MMTHNSQPAQASRQITEEQFNQLLSAILNGKYSWACVLLLRFAQCDPLLYMPYRTYNRLMKRNLGATPKLASHSTSSPGPTSKRYLNDLEYCEDITPLSVSIKGGTRCLWERFLSLC